MAENGCVIFAKNVQSMSTFYQATLDMKVSVAEESYEVLTNGSTELVIHAIPANIADTFTIDSPPRLRQNTAIKPAFVVASLDDVRKACETCGGGLNPDSDKWQYTRAQEVSSVVEQVVVHVLDGWDPEGNVIQFKQSGN